MGLAVMSASGLSGAGVHARAQPSAEQRADSLAAQYLVRAGYDAGAAERFLARMQAEQERSGGDPGGLLATHPRTADRRKQIEKLFPTSLHPPPRHLTKQNFSACARPSGITTISIRASWAYVCPETTHLLLNFPAGHPPPETAVVSHRRGAIPRSTPGHLEF